MANNPLVYDSPTEAIINAFCGAAEQRVRSRSTRAAQPIVDGSLSGTLLATMTFGATAFASGDGVGVRAGPATANTITAGTVGQQRNGRVLRAGHLGLIDGLHGLGGYVGRRPRTSTRWRSVGAIVSCASFTVTMPQT